MNIFVRFKFLIPLAAFVVLWVLQIFPTTGVILMVLGAPMFTGLLLQAALVTLLVEAVIGSVPRFLVAIPLLVYGSYYAMYAHEAIGLQREAAYLRSHNPGRVIEFNPENQSLVMTEARRFVELHAVPVAYEAGSVSGSEFKSYRLISHDRCDDVKRDTAGKVFTFGVLALGKFQGDVCNLSFPEAPIHPLVKIDKIEDGNLSRDGRSRTTYKITTDGKTLGAYTTVSAWRLSTLPFPVIGCSLNSGAPSWNCAATLGRHLEQLDVTPNSIDKRRFDDPVSVMLGVRLYEADDFKAIRHKDSGGAVANATLSVQKVEGDRFKIFEAIVAGQDIDPPPGLTWSISREPSRLIPLAQKMADRLAAVEQTSHELEVQRVANCPPSPHRCRAHANDGEHKPEIVGYILAEGLGALPNADFKQLAPQIFSIIKTLPVAELHCYRSVEAQRLLARVYVRAADIGAEALPFYEDQFAKEDHVPFDIGILPPLAICRIGRASAETITLLKQRLEAARSGTQPTYEEALFIALVSVGQQNYLKALYPESSQERQKRWFLDILAGKGLTSIGPNNCAPRSWSGVAPPMAPSLTN